MSAILKQQNETLTIKKAFLESRLASLDCLLSNMELVEEHRKTYNSTRSKLVKDLKSLEEEKRGLVEKIKVTEQQEKRDAEEKRRIEEEERKARLKAEEEARKAEIAARKAELEAKKQAEEEAKMAREEAEKLLEIARANALEQLRLQQEETAKKRVEYLSNKKHWFEVLFLSLLYILSGCHPIVFLFCVFAFIYRRKRVSGLVFGLTFGNILGLLVFISISFLLFYRYRQGYANINNNIPSSTSSP